MFAAGDQILQQQFPSPPIMAVDGRWRAHVQQAPDCPRCASTNTKFCYYNNYSLAQPRYFCKGCKRYWTKGGSLRNVPVGGGCRKSRRSRSKGHSSQRNDKDHTRHANSGDSLTDSSSSSGKSTGAEIDLAAVFARYLGQEPGIPIQANEQEKCQIAPLDGVFDQDAQQREQGQCSLEGLDQGWQEGNNLRFASHVDLRSFDDHGLLLAEDVFWSTSENGSSLSSSFAAWEPMAALEELDSSQLGYACVLDDQLRSNSVNPLVSDPSWSCFDLAGYGDFCRP